MFTIDDYYDIEFYNSCLNALKNNNVQYREFINIKPPFKWYINIISKENPIMINYDNISYQEKRYLISKTKPLKPNEEHLLTRRNDYIGINTFQKYTTNDSLNQHTDFVVYFNASSKEEMLTLTKQMPFKVFYLGKYYNNKYRVMMCTDKMSLNFIKKENVLFEYTGKAHEAEAQFNYKILREQDYIEKYTETPYFFNGKYYTGNIRADKSASLRYVI